MRNLKRNVSAFVICVGITITTLFMPTVANAATAARPAPASVSVLVELEASVGCLLDLDLFTDAAVRL